MDGIQLFSLAPSGASKTELSIEGIGIFYTWVRAAAIKTDTTL
jgi:hypothetical protein